MLFTPRLLLVNGQEVTTLRKPAVFGQAVYVAPRADCSFRRVRLSAEGREATAAAHMRAKSEALPSEDGSRLVLDKPRLTGENARQTSGAVMAGVWSYPTSPQHLGRYLPETLAQLPLENGARVAAGLSGYEGQIWTDYNLTASRWWARPPTDLDWDGFIRAAQETLGPLDMPLPPAVGVPWRDDLPIFETSKERLSQIFSPAHVAGLAAAGLACAALYLSGQYMRESIALNSVTGQSEALRSGTQQIQSERRRALANLGHVRRYRMLGNNGTVLAGLSSVAAVVGQTDMGLDRASFRDGNMELMLKGYDEISVPDVVSLLEAQPTLSSVSVSLEAAQSIVIKAEISAPRAEAVSAPIPIKAPVDAPADVPVTEPIAVPLTDPLAAPPVKAAPAKNSVPADGDRP